MALSMLSGDEQGIVLFQLYNVLDPRLAVDFSSVSHEVWEPTRALLQQLRADHKVAAALGHKAGMRSCKEMREAKEIKWMGKALSETDLATLGTLGSVLPALERLELLDSPTRVLRTHWGMLRLELLDSPTATRVLRTHWAVCCGWRRGWAQARCRP